MSLGLPRYGRPMGTQMHPLSTNPRKRALDLPPLTSYLLKSIQGPLYLATFTSGHPAPLPPRASSYAVSTSPQPPHRPISSVQADSALALETQLGRVIPHPGRASCLFLKAPAGPPALGQLLAERLTEQAGHVRVEQSCAALDSRPHPSRFPHSTEHCKDPFLCLFPRLPMGRHVFTCRGLCFAPC